MSSTERGRRAEKAVADYLKSNGFKVLEQNWRTRWCEIDVIATKEKTVFFVEVKYRETENQGDGLEYITPKKLKQMQFAAELWVSNHNFEGEYCLSAAAVQGSQYYISEFVEILN